MANPVRESGRVLPAEMVTSSPLKTPVAIEREELRCFGEKMQGSNFPSEIIQRYPSAPLFAALGAGLLRYVAQLYKPAEGGDFILEGSRNPEEAISPDFPSSTIRSFVKGVAQNPLRPDVALNSAGFNQFALKLRERFKADCPHQEETQENICEWFSSTFRTPVDLIDFSNGGMNRISTLPENDKPAVVVINDEGYYSIIYTPSPESASNRQQYFVQSFLSKLESLSENSSLVDSSLLHPESWKSLCLEGDRIKVTPRSVSATTLKLAYGILRENLQTSIETVIGRDVYDDGFVKDLKTLIDLAVDFGINNQPVLPFIYRAVKAACDLRDGQEVVDEATVKLRIAELRGFFSGEEVFEEPNCSLKELSESEKTELNNLLNGISTYFVRSEQSEETQVARIVAMLSEDGYDLSSVGKELSVLSKSLIAEVRRIRSELPIDERRFPTREQFDLLEYADNLRNYLNYADETTRVGLLNLEGIELPINQQAILAKIERLIPVEEVPQKEPTPRFKILADADFSQALKGLEQVCRNCNREEFAAELSRINATLNPEDEEYAVDFDSAYSDFYKLLGEMQESGMPDLSKVAKFQKEKYFDGELRARIESEAKPKFANASEVVLFGKALLEETTPPTKRELGIWMEKHAHISNKSRFSEEVKAEVAEIDQALRAKFVSQVRHDISGMEKIRFKGSTQVLQFGTALRDDVFPPSDRELAIWSEYSEKVLKGSRFREDVKAAIRHVAGQLVPTPAEAVFSFDALMALGLSLQSADPSNPEVSRWKRELQEALKDPTLDPVQITMLKTTNMNIPGHIMPDVLSYHEYLESLQLTNDADTPARLNELKALYPQGQVRPVNSDGNCALYSLLAGIIEEERFYYDDEYLEGAARELRNQLVTNREAVFQDMRSSVGAADRAAILAAMDEANDGEDVSQNNVSLNVEDIRILARIMGKNVWVYDLKNSDGLVTHTCNGRHEDEGPDIVLINVRQKHYDYLSIAS